MRYRSACLLTSLLRVVFSSVGISLIIMEVIESAVVAFFVCFAEDPNALASTKSLIYDAMVDSIQRHRQARPQIFANQPNPIPQRPGQPQQNY
jgi:hypothetical protein